MPRSIEMIQNIAEFQRACYEATGKKNTWEAKRKVGQWAQFFRMRGGTYKSILKLSQMLPEDYESLMQEIDSDTELNDYSGTRPNRSNWIT